MAQKMPSLHIPPLPMSSAYAMSTRVLMPFAEAGGYASIAMPAEKHFTDAQMKPAISGRH